ncbi:MAG: DUF5305 family protein [Bacilli bacterium]|nr:DUF5305 family protein [Bacilli bacterium]
MIEKEKSFNMKYLKYGIYLLLIIVAVVLAQYFTSRKLDDIVLTKLDYFDKPSIDYRVYYNENEYFNQKYLEKGNTYVSKLVNHIDVDFNYYLSYSDKVSASSNYNIVATIVASDANSGEVVWDSYQKELLETKTISIKDSKDYNISETVSIDYQEFDKFLNDFRNNNQMPVKAYLKVGLYVANSADHAEYENITSSNAVEVQIPLNEVNFKIAEKSESKKDIFMTTESRKKEKMFSMIIGGVLWVVAVILAASLALQYHEDVKKEGAYNRKLRKILSTYDSIIVNVEKLPFVGELSVVYVTSFEELVDAQSEVRLPINFKENKAKHVARFVLIRNNLAWVYTLKEGDVVEK